MFNQFGENTVYMQQFNAKLGCAGSGEKVVGFRLN
jgi:hypothetical protein